MADMHAVQEKLNHFTDDFQSVVLGSITNKGEPFTSYVPFVKVEDTYYLIMSRIAKHYVNIKGNPTVSLLFIEDESKAQNIFFRRRLSYLCKTSFDIEEKVKDAFVRRFGEFVNRLFLMDFLIVKCEIKSGSFIIGPGQAYDIDQDQKVIAQMTGNKKGGHQSS